MTGPDPVHEPDSGPAPGRADTDSALHGTDTAQNAEAVLDPDAPGDPEVDASAEVDRNERQQRPRSGS